jgi:hypothetical protein
MAAKPTPAPATIAESRLAGDELGNMTLCEGTLIDGGGSQLAPFEAARWGDYSSMNIDPSDDCTFWYTNEYYETTSLVGWKTRIGSFTMPGCVTAEPTPAPTTISKPTCVPTMIGKPTPAPTMAVKPTPALATTESKGTKSNDTKSKDTKSKSTKSKDTKSKGTKGKGSQKGKGKGYPVSAEIQEGKGHRVRRRDV